jgi:glycine/D-amino acid oxidase-like deaminating enzyme
VVPPRCAWRPTEGGRARGRETSVDVLVVGGGVHGASAAWHLARRGVDVLLVERGELAGGPTGRSSAVCRAYYTDPFLARVARESLDLLADVRRAHRRSRRRLPPHRRAVPPRPRDTEVVARTAAALTAIGTTTDLLTPAELATRFPRLALDGVACAAYEHGAGYADPVLTTTAMVEHARELGARVRLRTEVVALDVHGGTDRGVTVGLADGTRVAAGRVLLAAGPWTGRLARLVGASLPLTVERHVVATFATAGTDHLDVVMADVPGGYYVKPEVGAAPGRSADPGTDDRRPGCGRRADPRRRGGGARWGAGAPPPGPRARRSPAAAGRASTTSAPTGSRSSARSRRGWWSTPGPAGTGSSWRRRSAGTSPGWCSARRIRASPRSIPTGS